MFRKLLPYIAGATAFMLLGGFLAWGVHALWQVGNEPLSGTTLSSQLMHRKTRTMEQILDGLVRGDMRRVEKSAAHMKSIGDTLNWYTTIGVYENHNEAFRDSTIDLRDAAGEKNLDAAKEAALRLERSCIECHALINSR